MMVKKIYLNLFLLLLFTAGYAQPKEKIKGNRNVTIQESQINSFNKIVVGEKFKIDLIEGSEASVFVEADDNLHDIISFSVTDSTLYFETTKRVTTFKKFNIKVSYTNALKTIETIEDGEVSSLTSIDAENLTLTTSGTSRAFLNVVTGHFNHINKEKARVKLNVKCKKTNLELSDNSKIEALIETDSLLVDLYQRSDAKIEGVTQQLQVRADNSSNFVGKNLTATIADISTDLNSDVYVQVLEALTIEASGSGEVYIYGTPKIVLNKFADTAKLHKKEL